MEVAMVEAVLVLAKFHYTDPTRTGPDTDKVRAHCRRRAKFHYTDTDTDPTTCADFVRVRVRVGFVSGPRSGI